jgi:IclR family transcriptional regulator, pca regulon regulatory protein
MKETDFVKSLKKGLEILEAFTADTPYLKFFEISKKTKLPKSTISRLLYTLKVLNYIALEPQKKYYFLTPKVMELGFTVLSSMSMRTKAIPYLEELSRLTEQNVNLAILDGTKALYIHRVEKRKIVNINTYVGIRLNLYNTAIGRVILAFLDEGEIHSILNKLLKDSEAVKNIGPQGERLLESLKKIRKKGYDVDDESFMKGLRAVAAPIFNKKKKLEGAINISVFAFTVSRDHLIQQYVPLLIRAAEKISACLGLREDQKGNLYGRR